MAYDYNKVKEQYEKLNDQQKQQFANDNSGQVQDFLKQYNAEKNQTSTPVNNTTTATTNNTVAKPEYQGNGTTNTKQSSYQNQGAGNYSYNPTSGYYEKQNQTSNNVSTGNTKYPGVAQSVANEWNNLSYDQQQQKLKENPKLQEYLTNAGIINKSAPTTSTNQTSTDTGKTPSGQWDYQDNSPERMAQMVENVNRMAITNPDLFSSEEAFKNFFIDGVNRSPEQEKFLMDFYRNRQIYNKLDTYTAGDIGNMYVNGKVPDSYLNYLKTSNPERYAEVMDAKDKSEDSIANQANLDALAEEAGLSDSSAMKYAKDNKFLIDKDNNGVDDKLYIAPTEEELTKQNRINEIDSRIMEIKNMQKNMLDDLTEQYPGVPKATLMGIVQDRTKDISREYDDLMVERAGLVGSVEYLQNERDMESKARQQTINNLQKAYGMYYDYTPEGMSELAQAQYAATNVTLDQAENGTDTQKQMALDKVLSDYYDKYGSIIQRSKSQVINDVMAYAKKNGVSLSQALEDNFLSQLRKKPGFAALNTVESKDPYVVKVGDAAYRYNPETDEFELITGGVTTGAGGTTQFGESIRTGDTIGNDINSIGHILDSEDGLRVGTYKSSNGYTYNVYANREDGIQATENLLKRGYYGMTLGDAAQKWIGQGKDISAAKKVIKDKGLSLDAKLSDENVRKFIEAMGTWEGTLKNGKTLDDWAKESNNDFSEYKNQPSDTANNQNSKYGNKSNWNPNGYSDNLTGEYEAYLTDPTYENKSDLDYKLSQFGITFEDFTEQAKNYARTGMKDSQVDSASTALEAAIDLYEYINGSEANFAGWGDSKQGGWYDTIVASWLPGSKAHDAHGYYDTLGDRLTLDKLIETKRQGATYGAMSEGEWKLLKNAATSLDWTSSSDKFQKNLEDLIWTLTRTVEQGGGTLPSNFTNSAASKYVLESKKSGKYNPYIQDNTPMDYNDNGAAPSRIS